LEHAKINSAHSLPPPQGRARDFFRNGRKLKKNVLTAKKGRFLDALAGKRGVRAGKKAFCFSLFHVLVIFIVRKLLSVSIFQKI